MFSCNPPMGLLFVVGSIVFLFFVSASPIFQENESTIKAIEPKRRTRSIKLVYKRNDFLEMEERGFVPAWVDSQGLMRIPSTENQADIELGNFRSKSIDHHGVVVPFIHPSTDINVKFQDANYLSRLKEFVPSLRRRPIKSGSQEGRIRYPIGPVEDCIECNTNFLTPTLTYADGSDIFFYELHDLSHSYPTEFNESSVSLPTGCYFAQDYEGHLICSNPLWTKVPDNLPSEPLSIFEMNNTSVRNLESCGFNQLNAVVIKLDGNSIKTIETDAFYGINGVLSLSVRQNSIQSLDWLQFNGLSQLLVLSLRGNKINLTSSFQEEPTNETLVLPDLVHLDLSENPLGALNQFVFWALRGSPIEELNLKSCNLSNIHPAAFENLTSLRHIDLYNNSGLFPTFVNEIRVPTMSPNLERIGLGFSKFVFNVPTQLFQNFSETLVTVNLSGNLFIRVTDSLLPASDLPNLQYLILEKCSITHITEGAFQDHNQLLYLYLSNNQLTEILPNQTLPPSLQLLSIRQNPVAGGEFYLTKETLSDIYELRWLDMSFMKLESSNLSADVFNSLRKLNILQMRNTGLLEIPPKLFSPFSELSVLDLGQNAIKTLPSEFSEGLNNVDFVFLDSCLLDFSADEPISYQPFRSMSNVYAIFLNRNKISEFPPNLVANLTTLCLLHLAENNILEWHTGTTAFMPAAAAIDVSNNRIVFLPNQTYEEFSRINAIDLSDNALTCNCQARDLQRLANSDSINTTVLNWEKENAYICTETTSDSKDDIIKQIPLMSEEEFHCESKELKPDPGDEDTKTIVSAVVGSILILGVLLLLGAVCCCKRSSSKRKFFYFRQNVTTSLDFRSENQDDDENHNEYEYDAFISFNEQDRPWVYTQLVPKLEPPKDSLDSSQDSSLDSVPSFHLCLHDRDFTVGQQITANIIENIAKSRKVVIVLSRSYVESKWCQFELHLSQHRLLESERRDALVLILLEDVPKQHQNAGLRYLLSTRTYLAWRNDIEGQQLFWHRLRQVLTVRHQKSSLTSSHQSVVTATESST